MYTSIVFSSNIHTHTSITDTFSSSVHRYVHRYMYVVVVGVQYSIERLLSVCAESALNRKAEGRAVIRRRRR